MSDTTKKPVDQDLTIGELGAQFEGVAESRSCGSEGCSGCRVVFIVRTVVGGRAKLAEVQRWKDGSATLSLFSVPGGLHDPAGEKVFH